MFKPSLKCFWPDNVFFILPHELFSQITYFYANSRQLETILLLYSRFCISFQLFGLKAAHQIFAAAQTFQKYVYPTAGGLGRAVRRFYLKTFRKAKTKRNA
jgi:hypothetical protein